VLVSGILNDAHARTPSVPDRIAAVAMVTPLQPHTPFHKNIFENPHYSNMRATAVLVLAAAPTTWNWLYYYPGASLELKCARREPLGDAAGGAGFTAVTSEHGSSTDT
jgi:hypothetical protein